MALQKIKIIKNNIEDLADLTIWEKENLKQILEIIYSNFKNPKIIKVLDIGCSMRVVAELSKHVGQITGINLYFDKPTFIVPDNCSFFVMDGTKMEFQDETFDFIYSTNVFEHIKDFDAALAEQRRVARYGGLIYSSWYPIWSGPRGHHIHDDASMAGLWYELYGATKEVYKNDGTFIPDWSHLFFSPQEMQIHLMEKFNNESFTSAVVDQIYFEGSLNRIFFDDVLRMLHQSQLQHIYLKKNVLIDIPNVLLSQLKARHGKQDFSTSGCEILLRKSRIFMCLSRIKKIIKMVNVIN